MDEDRLAYRPAEAAQLLGIGRSKVYELINLGALPAIRMGGCVRIPAGALREWIAKQLAEARPAA